MGVGNMKLLRLLPLLLLFSGFSLAQTAEDLNISQSEMIEIENRISSLSANELNARKVLLNDEIASLEAEQEETQNPSRLKEISESLNKRFAELNLIEKFIAILLPAITIDNLLDDGLLAELDAFVHGISPDLPSAESDGDDEEWYTRKSALKKSPRTDLFGDTP